MMPTLMVLIDNVAASYQAAHTRYLARVERGVQPLPEVLGWVVGGITVYALITFVLYRWMAARTGEGFKLKSVIAIYNVICVFAAAYVVVGYIYTKLTYNYPPHFACNDNESIDEATPIAAHLLVVFFAQKFWEFLDTWFFILRKNFRQVTVLHVYHHMSIVAVVGILIPYNYSGDIYLPVFLNSCVHVIMYAYYAATILEVKTIVSIVKPYITTLQLAQFLMIGYQAYLGSNCMSSQSLFANVLLMLYMLSMLVLFSNFFLQSYIFKPSAPNRKQDAQFQKKAN